MSTAPTTTIETEDNKVFVGNLSYSTDKDTLHKHFESAGNVTHAVVIKRSKHRSAGYGFVTFETTEQAEKAATTLDKTELDGREISVQIARAKQAPSKQQQQQRSLPTRRPTTTSTTRIFVANLPYVTTDDELADLFKDFTIDSASIARLRNGRSKGYGFVDVANEVEQQKIINEFKPVTLAEREVSVKVALVPVEIDAAVDQVKQDEE
ncbi:hypothetical protein BC941DRAFT_469145 [Chlamydoabsidia padenii]|nr:hypothetical protein BC941DRAFT_469145 [Chlamydoabsidia padenii]